MLIKRISFDRQQADDGPGTLLMATEPLCWSKPALLESCTACDSQLAWITPQQQTTHVCEQCQPLGRTSAFVSWCIETSRRTRCDSTCDK